MSITSWIILVVANTPLYWLVGWVIFKDRGEFWECLKFWLTPDIISIFRGEWIEDQWSALKLGLWIFVCVAAVYGESLAVAKWLR